jgi:hypothetical protein|tara:strand:- start:76 stop:723 length:648 start_codon:yes stop_codon:yes gene_type:complete
MSRINLNHNVIIEDDKEIHDNCIIIDFTNKLEKDHNYLNENCDECLICFNKITKNMVIINNRYCKCFYYLVLCDKCFVNWVFANSNCFICRKTFQPRNKEFLELFNFINRGILLNVRLNSLNNKINRQQHRINNRFMSQINNTDIISSNINTDELNEIQILVPNSIEEGAILRRNINQSSNQITNPDALLRFGFLAILGSIFIIFISVFHWVKIG